MILYGTATLDIVNIFAKLLTGIATISKTATANLLAWLEI
jgi:hypothetical protein